MNTQQITKFDKTNLPLVRKAMEEALSKVTEQFGLGSIKLGNVSYDPDGGTFRTPLTATVKPEFNQTAKRLNEEGSRMLGYDRNIVGEQFTNAGNTFEITGIDMKRPKYPVNAKNTATDQSFKFSAAKKFNFKNAEIKYDEACNIFARVHLG